MKLDALVVALLVVGLGCGSSESKPDPAELMAEIVPKLKQVADKGCACADTSCFEEARDEFVWIAVKLEKQRTAPAPEAEWQRLLDCQRAHEKKAMPDAGVPATADAAPAPAAKPKPAPPAGLTAAHIRKLDAMMATLESLRTKVAAAGADCKQAAAVVTEHWNGFTPVNKVLREVNPKGDPTIGAWLMQHYMRPAVGAVGTLVGVGLDGCDRDPAWTKAVDASDFIGAKRR